ncbi:hypothetical protein EPI10_002319 [Gossypium australe]|uniref:Uncharacterized protein n=1 Tax=Gossypium australe TaxID=47621 RepID=A0A5B6VE19_9ROSI|nr:hypothetical protein EPI10_002319 [Gossypium australe]
MWRNNGIEEATWKSEDSIHQQYLHLFESSFGFFYIAFTAKLHQTASQPGRVNPHGPMGQKLEFFLRAVITVQIECRPTVRPVWSKLDYETAI